MTACSTTEPIRPPKPLRRRDATPDQLTAHRKIRRRWLDDTATWAITQFTDPDAWAAVLWAAAMHPTRPTVTNLALIATQAPYEACRTLKQWRGEGRKVRKGEHGMLIYTSVLRPDEDGEGPDTLRGFGTGTLFAYSQTDPAPGTAEQTAHPGPPHPRRPEELTAAARIHIPDSQHTGPAAAREALATLTAVPRLTPAEAASAAHLAALILGAAPGPAPALPTPVTSDADEARDELRTAAQRVIDVGRAVAGQFAAVHVPPF